MNQVLQSGNVTPTHLASWTTDGVIQDAGFSFANTYAVLSVTAQQINFNSANTDNAIVINLPAGFTRYRITRILITGATASISTATCGVFTAQSAGGTAIVTSATAITVTQTAGDTNHNMQSLTINNQDTMFFVDGVIYFRVQGAQGSAALANVTVFYEPMP
jgi:uncharacterized membrane protein YphA (DoxX/SURF4 family)